MSTKLFQCLQIVTVICVVVCCATPDAAFVEEVELSSDSLILRVRGWQYSLGGDLMFYSNSIRVRAWVSISD